MKNIYLALLVICLSIISCKKDVKSSDEEVKVSDTIKTKETTAEPVLDSAAQMKAWVDYATPGNAHKMMADETGTWNCEMTFWMEPNAKPEQATSTAQIRMILGGRYQEAIYSGKMMGQPFQGKGTLAYNNASKEYTATFIDNMGTGMMISVGKYNESSKSIELKGDMVNPVNGKKAPYREIYTIVDAKTRKMEVFDVKNGEEYKSMQIIMKKK